MAFYDKRPYTNFRGTNVKTIRLQSEEGDNSKGAILVAASLSTTRTVGIRDTSGTLAVGLYRTVLVGLPSIALGGTTETLVTISGVNPGDILVASIQMAGNSSTVYFSQNVQFGGITAGSGNASLFFCNPITTGESGSGGGHTPIMSIINLTP